MTISSVGTLDQKKTVLGHYEKRGVHTVRMRQLVGRRQKERPSEAVIESHAIMLRGGYIRQVATGVYSLLPPARRITKKIEKIIREEMDRIGGQEVLMPLCLPRELWDESGRYEALGDELLRFRDRVGHEMLLAMTHEEAVLHLCRHEVTSYKQLPAMVYQIQLKFRDEPRPRAGLIRVREFTMKDAYSFHTSEKDLEHFYGRAIDAYQRIFERCGLPEVAVATSDAGMMGGARAHEFLALCEAGEDTIVHCEKCSYIANSEVAEGRVAPVAAYELPLEKVHTPNQKTIEEVAKFLGYKESQTAKAVFYHEDSEGKPVFAVIRGDLEIDERKLSRLIGKLPVKAEDDRIKSIAAVPGFASPVGIDLDECRLVIDHSVAQSNNLVCGANEEDYHYKNFNFGRDLKGFETVDIALVREGDACPRCDSSLKIKRGIEVGNIFQLGTKYTKTMGMTYLDEHGSARTPIMGSYGIGVERLMASVLELKRDEWGPIWPMSIAPWQVHICAIKYNNPEVSRRVEKLYDELIDAGIEVIVDDRNERPGVQFADADLLGVPLRLIVSDKTIKNDELELKRRGSKDKEMIALGDVVAKIRVSI